ncbi:MAG TPA: glycogen/starch synthase [Candidatus Lokiarchaeia archaeon]|nr:glycogen/starch synthase [Candidatus Lokiarchaeia archaeon]
MDYNTIVFVSFENQFAPVGGLAAVMKMLPPAISKYRKTILITPCFQNIPSTRKALENGQIIDAGLRAQVHYMGYSHPVEIFEAHPILDNMDYTIYLVKSNSFFLSGENPYIDTWRIDALYNDAYFLCKSVPVVLDLVKETAPPAYVIDLQDWETALVIETMDPAVPNKCVLTLHNCYDHPLHGDPEGRYILQFTIPRMQGISAVSEQFSYELTHDVLQTQNLARNLQYEFSLMPPVGINNGNFVELTFPEGLASADEIMDVKMQARGNFNDILHSRDDLSPTWGQKIDLMTQPDIPIFLLFGRDEPKQKGFDVAAAAIQRLLAEGGTSTGYFIFTPIPGVHGLASLEYLDDLCKEFSENVMVFAYRLSDGYKDLQQASSYVIMPSYYEPFGAANEAYASGVPVIARATGGLIQQVRPLNLADLPMAIQGFVQKYHGDKIDSPTGYLYREHASTETGSNWAYLLATDFSKRRSIQEPVNKLNPVFWSMVTELGNVLGQAVEYYKKDKEGYCKFIVNGIDLFKEFSWDASARNYFEKLYHVPLE